MLVLLIACANVAGLLVSRATARSREMAIRVALGAGRVRLLRQLLTESLILGAAGGCVGLLVALWTADVLPSFFPADQARMLDTSIDARVLAFTAFVSLIGSLLFGTFPALHGTRRETLSALRGDICRLSDGRSGTRLRRALVVAQVALAVVLMVSASLLARSLSNALRADLGFGTREAVLASVELPLTDFSPAQGSVFYQSALERVRALPGVEAASLVRTLPLSGGPRRRFNPEGYQPQPGEDAELHFNIVAPGYFETMQMPVRAGRTFDDRDRGDSEPVAIVNETFARRYFVSDAVGRHVTDSSGRTMRIVGVVKSGTYLTVQEPQQPHVYYPLSQSYSPRMTMVARTARSAGPQTDGVRRVLRDVNPGVAVFRSTTLRAHVDEALTGDRLTATLVGVCAAMALALAVIGIYGVLAYAVVRRTREIGLRIALGASRLQVVRLIVGEGIALTLAGLTVGVIATAGSSRLLATMLYGVSPTDVWTYAAAPSLFALVAAVAASVPARRALRVDPIAALREE
jgi:predicted permease